MSLRPRIPAWKAPLAALAKSAFALTFLACGRSGPAVPNGAPVVVTLAARLSDPSATDPGPLRDALRAAWSDRLRAAKEAGSLAVFEARVELRDAGALNLTAKVHLATDTCTQAQADAVGAQVRDLATTSVPFGFHRTLPDAAETLATVLRARPEINGVTTPSDAPGAIETEPDQAGVDLAKQLAPANVRVFIETLLAIAPPSAAAPLGASRSGQPRHRIWIGTPAPDLDSTIVVGTSVETTEYQQLAVLVRFTEAGAQAFGALTGRALKQPLLIVLGDRVLSAPHVMERLATPTVSIVLGQAHPDDPTSESEARALAAQIQFGTLPTTPAITELSARCGP